MENKVLILDIDGVVAKLHERVECISQKLFQKPFCTLDTEKEIKVWNAIDVSDLKKWEDFNLKYCDELQKIFKKIYWLSKVPLSWVNKRNNWLRGLGLNRFEAVYNITEELEEHIRNKNSNLLNKHDVFLKEIKPKHSESQYYFIDDMVANLIQFEKEENFTPILLDRGENLKMASADYGLNKPEWLADKNKLTFGNWEEIMEFFRGTHE